MKRTVRGAIVVVVGGLIAAAMAPACVEYPQAIVVTKVVVPKAEKGACVISPETLGLVSGTLDIAVASGYTGSLVVENQLRKAKDDIKARVETSSIYLLGATVRLTLANGEALSSNTAQDGREGNEFRTEGSGFIKPNETSSITVNLLDRAAVSALTRRLGQSPNPADKGALQVIAFARVQAQTLGGLSIESQEFQFPITICAKCLVDFVKVNPQVPCSPPAPAQGDTVEKVCNPGQDTRVRCDQCEGFSEYCRTAL